MGLEKIAEYKKELGLTNEELANLSGVPKGTLDKILSGVTKDPKLGTLKALAKVFECTLDDFNDVILSTTDNAEEALLISNFKTLNNLGKSKLIEYSNDLIDTPKYIEQSAIVEFNPISSSNDDIELLAAHNDGLDKDSNSRNLEKIKAKYAEIKNNK